MVVRLFLLLCLAFLRVTAEAPVPHDLKGQVFIDGQVNQSAFISVSWKVEGGESGDLSFNVFHKRVSELGFQKTAVGNNMTVTLKNVMIGEEYEVRVSSLEHSSGKVSALSRGIIVGVNYVQEVVTASAAGAVLITCKFAHTSKRVGCVVVLTAGSFRRGRSAIASADGVTIPQATVEFTDLDLQEYTYRTTAYLVDNGELLQVNQSLSGLVTLLDESYPSADKSFHYEDFALMTVVIIVFGVVFLPVTLLLLVAICHEGRKKCTRKQRINGLGTVTVDELSYATETPKSKQQEAQTSANRTTQQLDASSHAADELVGNESFKDDSDSLYDLPPISCSSTVERVSMHALHGSAIERPFSHASSTSSFSKALSLSDVEPRMKNSADRKRKLSFKGSFPFIAVRRESVDRGALSKAYSCDTGLNAGTDGARPLGKAHSGSRGSEDTVSLRTSLFNIIDAFESQVISVPESPTTKGSADKRGAYKW